MKRIHGALLVAALAGCAGLPSKPLPPSLPAEAPLSEMDRGGNWPEREWWKRYGDGSLDTLIELSLESSPSIASAHARFDTARESVRLASAASGAHLEASGDAMRQRLSDNGLFPPDLLGFHWYNQFDLGVQATYVFDWWGKQKDAVDAALDEAHAAHAERTAAALLLASSVADTYFAWQADQGRLVLAHERETTLTRERSIAAARIHAQIDSPDEGQRAEAALAAVREQIAMLEGSAKLRIIALAALVGRAPSQLPPLDVKPLPQVGSGLPDSVKIDLIARRADLTASRWRVEAAVKNRAAARAEFFPDFSINALLGLQSRDIGKLLQYDSRVPEIAAAVHLPLFDAGRLKARYGGSQAAVDAAVASYRNTLIEAARDVATQAASRAALVQERAHRAAELAAADHLKASAAARVRQGLIDSRTELSATDAWIEQRDALLQLDAAALSSDIGLQQALGGGYERDVTTP